MRIAIIDNYDSFTYNLSHIVEQYCDECIVMRNDKLDWEELKTCDKIIFSPGPGLPSEVKVMGEILNRYAGKKAILGVCLGMQYIAEYYGAKIFNLPDIVHGVPKTTLIVESSEVLFKNISERFLSGRYHSWAVSRKNFPNSLLITSTDEEDVIMSIRHKELDLCGVQFHPESIMTENGNLMLKNWISG
ncbi:anthranilate synthase component II [Marinifilum caeruleilacunae]|uniref:Aminodeoxychorismate/anthranilate synthase component II n=1 Tax=Marinifilum caeruleilacunae TaxID=2499076 RepID=A0ABX1WXC1_9BACT|nr:aminodeoxychorismate/anthranilate synthase component II [Marinifilum caeruleilacunae]NOU60764.1 aminodeoxychorismate/anthranilate synthase component II [Marinifilum caeruleilacunae]